MKRLYYFSKAKLQFVEIKNYKAKLAVYFTLSVIVFSTIIFGGYFIINSILNSQKNIRALRSENKILKENLDKIASNYQLLNSQLDSLDKANNNLRAAVNLQPISQDELDLGIGGGSFNNVMDFFKSPSEEKLTSLLNFVDAVSRKVSFEKEQYSEISNQLILNQKLYAAIPAIKPCDGDIGDGFGMRYHPILHIERMHEGIDFVANEGTPVYATGDGTIDFVGYRGGFGLAVEIDHGFGYETVYAHLSEADVKEGQKVSRGEMIAKIGDSGLSTGPHLHYEVHHDGVKLNPAEFFFGDIGFFELTHKN
ncbi:MAG: M23 family metallopeptidase [Ignavibacteriaceae bacterium]